ncbi:MAG: rhomboid family intramembrane serine protease [Armatimonadetes bacterium]|nr:rhomboid family intramembrane serine protease [Armatimonadota bacterium]
MPVIPIRAKNPPERFPGVTIGLIAANFVIYGLTTHDFLSVRDDALNALAVSHATLSPWRLLTAMFLHANLLHILGNMLFLWVFGAALEGRLGHLRYLIVYLIAGMAGGLLSDLATFSSDPDGANLGASGAIFGLAGAYLYVFPYSHIRVLRVWLLRLITPPEWEARWVVGYYLLFNVVDQLQYQGLDGVGHLAHLGGAGAGLLCVWLMRTRRDDASVSAAQAVHADVRDMSLLSFPELEALMQRPTDNPRLVLAFCDKALLTPGGGEGRCLPALQHYARMLMERADPAALAGLLLRLSPAGAQQMPSVYYLRLGSRLESASAQTDAVRVYRRVAELFPTSADAEAAWFRAGRLQETFFGDRVQAAACYSQLLQRFPQGVMAAEAHRFLDALKAGGQLAENAHWQASNAPAAGGVTGRIAPTTDAAGVRYDLAGNPLP